MLLFELFSVVPAKRLTDLPYARKTSCIRGHVQIPLTDLTVNFCRSAIVITKSAKGLYDHHWRAAAIAKCLIDT